ncbi:hypothetical protein GCM10023264_09440 [Sphingomonas daechungensis]|uniref:hypothetical protein n=1 Tax=Sphingomonas daechungensis TaxID=1176646 RepID=UPI0031EB915B
MAIDSDSSIPLPTPPPPRPAARREAIDAALRNFDGVADAPAARAQKNWWASRQRQLGALATAAIVAVVGIPLTLTVLEDQPRPSAAGNKIAPQQAQRSQPPPDVVVATPVSEAEDATATDIPRSRLPLEPHETAPQAAVETEQKVANFEAPAAIAAAPPAPAPPPPPPPPPAPERGYSAGDAAADSVVVTGSRVREMDEPSSQHGRLAAKRTADALKIISPSEAYAQFLPRLQNAIRSGNPRNVSALVQYPLRVSSKAGVRIYPDRKSLEKDFDRIFTPHVRAAILAQRPDDLFVRDQGAMVGSGEVWFDQTCRNSDCSKVGPVRVKAVNP